MYTCFMFVSDTGLFKQQEIKSADFCVSVYNPFIIRLKLVLSEDKVIKVKWLHVVERVQVRERDNFLRLPI